MGEVSNNVAESLDTRQDRFQCVHSAQSLLHLSLSRYRPPQQKHRHSQQNRSHQHRQNELLVLVILRLLVGAVGVLVAGVGKVSLDEDESRLQPVLLRVQQPTQSWLSSGVVGEQSPAEGNPLPMELAQREGTMVDGTASGPMDAEGETESVYDDVNNEAL